MRKAIEKIAGKIKGRDYRIDDDISVGELIGVVNERFRMLVRGALRGLRLKKKGRFLFLGKHVVIKSPRKLSIGNGATVHDGCTINAMSRGGITIGREFTLGQNGVINCTGVIKELGESLEIGDNVGISPNFMLFVRGKVKIGSNTIIGPNVTIVAENHVTEDINTPIRKQGITRKGISIGENCWIGAGATILDGVSVGDGAVVAAGAVVNKDVEPLTVVGGVPAKIIKTR